jgi:tetratricopeptide (TPR) repeat protein
MKSWTSSLPFSCLLLSLVGTVAQGQEQPARRVRAPNGSFDIQAKLPGLIAQALEIRQALLDGNQTVLSQPGNERLTSAASTPAQVTQPSAQRYAPAPAQLNAQDVHRVLVRAQAEDSLNKVKQARYLRRVFLASTNSLDALMVLEMIQNRSLAKSVSKDGQIPKDTHLDDDPEEIERDPTAQHIFDLYLKEDYAAVITQGLPLLSVYPKDGQLRLIIANCLSWNTTRYTQAIELYQSLLNGPYARDASLGLANTYRWSGRDDLALPLYKTLIAEEPESSDIQDGLVLAQRAMRPRTLFSIGRAGDTNNMRRNEAVVAHRWRSDSGNSIYEVELGGTNDSMPDLGINQRNATLRFQNLDLPFKPTFEVSRQTTPQQTTFGGVHLELTDTTKLTVNRVNWGLLSFNVNAEAANLSASHVALASSQSGELGSIRGRVDYFGVSDGNTVLMSNLQFTPAWRPLGKHFKTFVGMQTRNQSDYSPLYWSPMNGGYGVWFAGVQAEWSNDTTDLYATAQAGNRLYGEGTRNWGLAAGGRKMLNSDLALGVKLSYYAGGQYGPTFSYASALVTIEKFW